MRKLTRALRYIWPDPQVALPSAGAITQRRYHLGARPLVSLFHAQCHPIATTQTRGAFLFGLRLMAIDGTKEDLPDTPENARAFGRHTSQRGASAFPQLLGVYLVSAAPMRLSMRASGPVTPVSGSARTGCCGRSGAGCW